MWSDLNAEQERLVDRICELDGVATAKVHLWDSRGSIGQIEGWIGQAYVIINRDGQLVSLNRVMRHPKT